MDRCLTRRLLLLTVICLTLGLSGCGGLKPIAKDSIKPENRSRIEVSCQGKNINEDNIVSQNPVFPSEIEGLQLISLLSGEEARDLMDGFLGSGCNIKEAYIAGYRGRDVELIIWIVEMWNEQNALDLLEEMNCRVKKSPSFIGYECLQDERVGKIYYARVKGGHPIFAHNYFYYKQHKIHWVNVSGDKPFAGIKKFIYSL